MRSLRGLLPVLLVALVLAPTAVAAPSSVGEVLPFETTTPDGTALRGHVYLPEGEGPFPTVLEFSPYWGTNYPRSGEAMVVAPDGRRTLHQWLAPFADAGYAVALVNMRGTDQSGGCMQWGTRIDARDGAQVVQELAAQPWSAGKVGMIGHSYPAWLAYLAMSERPSALGALAIASGIIDPWNLLTRNGAAFVLGPPAMPAATAGLVTGALGLNGPSGASTMLAMPPEHVTCPRYAEDAVPSADMLVRGDRNAYWDSVDLRPRLRGTGVPVLVANGLQQEGHMLQVEGLWELLEGAERRMVLGQWNHTWPHKGGLPGWQQMMVDWFDEHLRGKGQKVKDEVVDFQVEGGAWQQAKQWPPPAKAETLALDGDKLLPPGVAPPAAASVTSFLSDPQDPAPARCPERQALFVSPPLAEDVVIAGNFGIDLTLSSTLPDGNLAAVLFHGKDAGACPAPQPPTGSPLDGYLKMPTEVRRALGDLRHVKTAYGADFPVGTPTGVSLQSHPFATRIPAGERLILAVSGGARELFPETRRPVLSVTTGPTAASRLRLPVVDGRLRFAAG